MRIMAIVPFRERDRSGTTRNRMKCGAGDGANSPTQASAARAAARPNSLFYQLLICAGADCSAQPNGGNRRGLPTKTKWRE
jgi:hypothetical protein